MIMFKSSMEVQTAIAFVVSHPVLVVLGCIVLRIVYLFYFHPLANVPGPRLAAVTDLWKTQAIFRRKFASSLSEQHARHGNVVRIGPNEISVVEPDEVPTIYGMKSTFLKGPFYDTWAWNGPGHFSDRDPERHRRARHSVAGAYAISHLIPLEGNCDACTTLLCHQLDAAAEKHDVIDLSKLLEAYAYDAASAIGFGERLGLLNGEEDRNRDVLGSMAQANQFLVVVATLSNYNWLLGAKPFSWITAKIFGGKGPRLFVQRATKYVMERQALRRTDPAAYEEGRDMLYHFMKSKDSVTSENLSTKDVILNCVSIIIAGSDTTRASMAAFVRYVYAHHPTLQRLRQEMDDAIAAGQLTFPITYSQATRLEFMWACMKEAMRLYPAVGMPMQRVVPPGGHVIGGKFYPAGTLVGIAPREVHYDPRAYGKDASEWRPERWLEEDRNILERYSLVFGQGTRVCLGKNVSLVEMSKLLPTIVYNYDIEIKDVQNPWKLSESWFILQSEFFCSIKKREW